MDVREALYTTRAMRRVLPDPIPADAQARILDAAIRAPSGSNSQNWRFMLIDSSDVKARLGPIYRRCFEKLISANYAGPLEIARQNPDDPDNEAMLKMHASAAHLADNFESYPLLLMTFSKGDASGSAVLPATWSAMLAARAEGIGSAITSLFAFELDEFLDVLGVPRDEGWSFAACVTLGYPTGRWGVAPRRPAHEVSFGNRWGEPLKMTIPEPLWDDTSKLPSA